MVKTLRARMEHDFDKYGIEREYEPEPEYEDMRGNGASVCIALISHFTGTY